MSVVKFVTSKLFIAIVLVIIIIVGVAVSVVLLTDNNNGMRLRALAGGEIEMNRASDYKESRLYLKNGTFRLSVKYKEFPVFTGIGYFTKSGKRYTFTYINMWRLTGPNYHTDYKHDLDPTIERPVLKYGNGDNFEARGNNTVSVHYYVDRRGRLEIKCPNHRSYFFK